jgi:hypothetical protein
VDNWVLSGITTFSTGAPTTPTFSTVDGADLTGSSESAVITVTGDPRISKSDRTMERFFKTEVFQRTAKGSFGNAGIGLVRQPGQNNWDMALSKRFPLWNEKRYLQFRGETFNTWNHTQFSAANTQARFNKDGQQVSTAFGYLGGARSPRIVQLSLKAIF